ncbi:MAG: class IIb bacteriocin, lactobin A/cerein 7B family [Chloroflexia bacterium]|nr:class IIb bacteriocin, lactobin A/cerein 7B family [Chloroflexia bacterium]
MTALDTLSTFGSELTAEQLDHVDGGLLPLIIALAVFDAVLWGYIAYTQ